MRKCFAEAIRRSCAQKQFAELVAEDVRGSVLGYDCGDVVEACGELAATSLLQIAAILWQFVSMSRRIFEACGTPLAD
jgi:hypothetical protein